ncbi:HTH_Tnp_Tc3_2 domain-containing protein [Trichonephila clavipes]|nr:HTH_Tnp_Tc3_2 domain-containing protein [Trichonephila clavipes]
MPTEQSGHSRLILSVSVKFQSTSGLFLLIPDGREGLSRLACPSFSLKNKSLDINCWEQWTREDTHVWKTGTGATMKTTRRENRRIVRQALEDPTVTRSTIRADEGVAIAPQTIFRHLAEGNLKSK